MDPLIHIICLFPASEHDPRCRKCRLQELSRHKLSQFPTDAIDELRSLPASCLKIIGADDATNCIHCRFGEVSLSAERDFAAHDSP